MNASPITKITSWFKFLGKNLHLVDCATVWAKSKVMLTYIDMYFTYVSRYTRSMRWRIMLASEENADSMTFFAKNYIIEPRWAIWIFLIERNGLKQNLKAHSHFISPVFLRLFLWNFHAQYVHSVKIQKEYLVKMLVYEKLRLSLGNYFNPLYGGCSSVKDATRNASSWWQKGPGTEWVR